MGALPKRKISKRRQGNRRSHHRALLPAVTNCPRCHKPRRIYHACQHCGYYGDIKVLTVSEEEKKR